MKRPIKFRAQQIDTKEWVFGAYIPYSEIYGGAVIIMRTEDDSGCGRPAGCSGLVEISVPVNPNTVGQFTGLHDKNGKEIWEGDIDESGLFIGWNQLHCCFGLFDFSGFKREIIASEYDSRGKRYKEWTDDSLEIISNIYEYKELL
jgi:uncharacterized phage protein (TIGR01671 family)